MKIARVILTTECNKKCSYCCNRIPEIQQSFKMTTLDQFVEMDYDVVNITGGEPTIVIDKLYTVLMKLHPKTKKYMYSNGRIPQQDIENFAVIVGMLDGVNLGVHDNFMYVYNAALKYKELGLKNIRIQIQDTKVTEEIEATCQLHGFTLVKWKMNDCNKTEEDRWII